MLTPHNESLASVDSLKHDIPGLRLVVMVRETYAYGLPSLNVNPFSIRPLESGESGKLVGRTEVFTRLKTYLQLGTARKVMLLGPLGSGRTSLARCLMPYAGASATIDHLPAQTPATALLSMCYRQMIGGEPPVNRTELVNDLVNEMYSHPNKLPMIVIDVPASDLSVLEVALRDAHSSLERLNALLVLVCDVKERHHLPQTVIEGFEVQRLSPFSAHDVLSLVRQRLASVGVMDSEFSMHDASTILEECDGFPAQVITKLRDAVDGIRMQNPDGLPVQYVDTSAKIFPRDEPDALHQLMEDSVASEESQGAEADSPTGIPTETPVDTISSTPLESSAPTEPPSDVIDASMPWTQRPPLQPPQASAETSRGNVHATLEEDLPDLNFELDIGWLDEEKDQDEPLQESPFNPPIIDADAVAARSTTQLSGMFKGLAQRGKDANIGVKDLTSKSDKEQQELVAAFDGNEYWVNGSLLPQEPVVPVPEEESAVLLHDEVGLAETPLLDDLPPDGDIIGEPTPLPSEVGGLTDSHVLETFQAMMALMQKSAPASAHESLLAFFQERFQQRVGPKVVHGLNPLVLGSLNPAEGYVVAIAQERDYSPSDASMLQHLGVKRARLSQISNRLLKNGILQARQVGRSRKFSLTQAARAQLIAWGALKAGDAQ